MYKKKEKIDTIGGVLDFLKEVPTEKIQNWAHICETLTQLGKTNRIDEWMECRKKLKEIYTEYQELSKIKVFYVKEILRELKLRQIIE